MQWRKEADDIKASRPKPTFVQLETGIYQYVGHSKTSYRAGIRVDDDYRTKTFSKLEDARQWRDQLSEERKVIVAENKANRPYDLERQTRAKKTGIGFTKVNGITMKFRPADGRRYPNQLVLTLSTTWKGKRINTQRRITKQNRRQVFEGLCHKLATLKGLDCAPDHWLKPPSLKQCRDFISSKTGQLTRSELKDMLRQFA